METEGSVIGHYVGVKRLGAGSFGAAWLVADQSDKNAKLVKRRLPFSVHASRKVMKQIYVGNMGEGDSAAALIEAKLLEHVCISCDHDHH